jgi:hypothetical protein
MRKRRLNLYMDVDTARQVERLAAEKQLGKSAIVEAALLSFFSPDQADRREAVFVRRLDRLSRQLAKLERDQAITLETLGLFVRYFLSVTPALPEADQAAARAQGLKRYDRFIETLGRHLQQGRSLVLDLEAEFTAGPADFPADVPTHGAAASPADLAADPAEEADHVGA